MRLFFIVAVVAFSLGGLSPAAAADLATFGRLPQIEDVAVSADGKTLAVAESDGSSRTIIFYDAATGKRRAHLITGNNKVRDIRWVDSENLLIVITATSTIPGVIAPRAEYAVGVLFNLPTRTTRDLMNAGIGLNILFAEPAVRTLYGRPYIFVEGMTFEKGKGVPTLFRIDPRGGRAQIVDVGIRGMDDLFVGADGRLGAFTLYAEKANISALVVGKSLSLPSKDFRHSVSIIGRGRTADTLLASYHDEETSHFVEVSLTDGSWGAVFNDIEDDSALFDAGTGLLIGLRRLEGDKLNYTFFDAADASMWKALEAVYPGARIDLVDRSADRNLLIVHVDRAGEGPFYAMVDRRKSEASVIGPIYNDLKAEDVSPVRALRYTAADGLEITGYLTLPRKGPAKNLPLVVLPHGGPVARDEPGFDWWAQALAFQGYAVLQPNYRGSDGFGSKFLLAGMGEVGRKMQTDLSDGVRFLAAEGVIDPSRVCIVGASYGGYAALAGAALDRGVYRCAVSVAGISDLKAFLKTLKAEDGERAFKGWNYLLKGTGDVSLTDISPIRHVKDITIPVLLIHGRDDTVVNFDQSAEMERAMKRANKAVELVTLAQEDHFLSRGATRYLMLDRVSRFLAQYNPANPVPPPTKDGSPK